MSDDFGEIISGLTAQMRQMLQMISDLRTDHTTLATRAADVVEDFDRRITALEERFNELN